MAHRPAPERWGVSLRTVQRRLEQADLEPVGLVNRAPHFFREAVETAERVYGWRAHTSRPTRQRTWRPYRVCIAHRKGGVAKTTTTYYLGRELVLRGKRVILRDLDPQRTVSEALRALGPPSMISTDNRFFVGWSWYLIDLLYLIAPTSNSLTRRRTSPKPSRVWSVPMWSSFLPNRNCWR